MNQKKAEYDKIYHEQKTKVINIRLNKNTDADILEKIEQIKQSKSSVAGYIKSLIREDIKKTGSN